jgi:hypothetical protein
MTAVELQRGQYEGFFDPMTWQLDGQSLVLLKALLSSTNPAQEKKWRGFEFQDLVQPPGETDLSIVAKGL